MQINYYRTTNLGATPWKDCLFTSETNLDAFTVEPLVSINGLPILRRHQSTYLTGRNTCRAHHFAKLLATKVLNGTIHPLPASPMSPPSDTPEGCPSSTSHALTRDQVKMQNLTSTPSDRVPVSSDFVAASRDRVLCVATPVAATCNDAPVSSGSAAIKPGRVLWLDTLHGPHTTAQIYRDIASRIPVKENLRLICLDILGCDRGNVWGINRNFEQAIKDFAPDLVVIDDIDHFMPFCGTKVATEFCRIVRDFLNHTETSFLFIGYNHLNKRAGTTSDVGKWLQYDVNNVFSLSTQRDVTTVRLLNSHDLSRQPDASEYRFTIGSDNLPQEADKPNESGFDDAALRTLIHDILTPGESIAPDELYQQVITRHRQIKRQHRTTALIDQAIAAGLIIPSEDGTSYTLNNTKPSPSSLSDRVGVSSDFVAATPSSGSSDSSTPSRQCPVGGGSAAVNPSKTSSGEQGKTPEGCDSNTSHALKSSNNQISSIIDESNKEKLTLPPHPNASPCRDFATAPVSPLP